MLRLWDSDLPNSGGSAAALRESSTGRATHVGELAKEAAFQNAVSRF